MVKVEYKQPESPVEISRKNFQDRIQSLDEKELLKIWNYFNISNKGDFTFDDLNTIIEEFGVYKNDFIDIVSGELEKRYKDRILSMDPEELNKTWEKLKKLNTLAASESNLTEAGIEFYGVPMDICFKIASKEMLNKGLLSKEAARNYGVI